MGWLGWSYDQTIDTPMPVIELAMAGLVEKLAASNPFGGGKPAPVESAPPSGAAIMSVFRAAAAGDPDRRASSS